MGTIVTELYYKNKVVLNFALNMSVYGFAVFNTKILCQDNLPLSIQCGIKKGKDINQLLHHWLENRIIPDYRVDLDELMCNEFNIPMYKMGRMCYTQHTAAFLHGWTSVFDEYSVEVQSKKLFTYVLEDPCFWNIYMLLPQNEHSPWTLYDKNFTLPSELKSKLECNNKTIYLIQTCSESQIDIFTKKKEIMCDYFNLNVQIKGNQFTTNFSYLHKASKSIWLSEIIPFINNSTSILEQCLEWMPNKKAKGILKKIFAYEKKCRMENIPVSINELGIAADKNEAYPIIIL